MTINCAKFYDLSEEQKMNLAHHYALLHCQNILNGEVHCSDQHNLPHEYEAMIHWLIMENNNTIPPLCNGANGSPLPEINQRAMDDIYMNNFKIIMSQLPSQDFISNTREQLNRNSNDIEFLQHKVKSLSRWDLWYRFVAAFLSTSIMALTIKFMWF